MANVKDVIPKKTVVLREDVGSDSYYWITSGAMLNYLGCKGKGKVKIYNVEMSRVPNPKFIEDYFIYQDRVQGIFFLKDRADIFGHKGRISRCVGKTYQ